MSDDSTKKKRRRERAVTTAAALVAFDPETTGRLIDETERGIAELEQVVRTWGNCPMPQQAGRAAEVFHARTLNADAIMKGLDVQASTTASAGLPCAAADVVVQTPTGTVQAQVKWYASAESNAQHLANPKYAGMQQVVPAEQVDAVRARAADRASTLSTTRPHRAEAYAEVAERATDRVSAGGAESQPLNQEGAEELVRDPESLREATEAGQLGRDLRRGAIGGAIAGGALSAVQHGWRVCHGDEELGDAALAVGVDTAKGAVKGVLTTAGARVVSQGLVRAGMNGLARGALPVTIAATAIDAGGSVVKYARGQISGEECLVRTGKSVATGAAGWAGAEVGFLVGSCLLPGVGTVIGGLLGGLVGSFAASRLLR